MARRKKVSGNDVKGICSLLMDHQSLRCRLLRSRKRVQSSFRSVLAFEFAKRSGDPDAFKKGVFKKHTERANELFKDVIKTGEVHPDIPWTKMTLMSAASVREYMEIEKQHETTMKALAKELAELKGLTEWIEHPDQTGFGYFALAQFIGETGDLSNYVTPAKLWKRMGLFPITKNGRSHMGSTWRKYTKKIGFGLSPEEWTERGYRPSRRSAFWLIGASLLKANGADTDKARKTKLRKGHTLRTEPGPYWLRWMKAKHTAYLKHPEWDWGPCNKCGGTGIYEGVVCETCGGLKVGCKQAQLHGCTLATKLLGKKLLVEWNDLDRDYDQKHWGIPAQDDEGLCL